jgi:hypothetical protein
MTDRPATPRNLGDKDAPHMSPVTPAEDARTIMLNRISWGAVLAGVVTALVTQLILNMIGIGIGVATLDPTTGDNPQASTFSMAASIWWTLSGIIASFAGGYVAGRLSGRPKESTAGFHGLTAWAATTLVVFYLLTTTLGSLLGGVYNTISGAVGGLGRTATQAVQTVAPSLAQNADPFSSIEQQLRATTGGTDPAQLRDAAMASLRAAFTGDPAQAQQARDQAADALARAQNIPPEEARNRIAQYEQQYRQAVDRAKQAADAAKKGIATATLLGAVGLILGAIAGWFGGRSGAVEPTITTAALAGERRR